MRLYGSWLKINGFIKNKLYRVFKIQINDGSVDVCDDAMGEKLDKLLKLGVIKLDDETSWDSFRDTVRTFIKDPIIEWTVILARWANLRGYGFRVWHYGDLVNTMKGFTIYKDPEISRIHVSRSVRSADAACGSIDLGDINAVPTGKLANDVRDSIVALIRQEIASSAKQQDLRPIESKLNLLETSVNTLQEFNDGLEALISARLTSFMDRIKIIIDNQMRKLLDKAHIVVPAEVPDVNDESNSK